MSEMQYILGIDIGSTTVKIAILDSGRQILFSDYQRHFANIRETLSQLLQKAYGQLGDLTVHPMITGSGGLTIKYLRLTIPRDRMLTEPDIDIPYDTYRSFSRGHVEGEEK